MRLGMGTPSYELSFLRGVVEQVPANIVLPGVGTVGYPLHSSNGHHQGTEGQERGRLPRMRPIRIKQKPRRAQPPKRFDHFVQDRTIPGRVRDDVVRLSDIDAHESSRVNAANPWAGRHLRIEVAHSRTKTWKSPHECTISDAWLIVGRARR